MGMRIFFKFLIRHRQRCGAIAQRTLGCILNSPDTSVVLLECFLAASDDEGCDWFSDRNQRECGNVCFRAIAVGRSATPSVNHFQFLDLFHLWSKPAVAISVISIKTLNDIFKHQAFAREIWTFHRRWHRAKCRLQAT